MPTRWFTSDDSEIPTPVECDEIGYPHRDALGRTQYDNTHFDSEREAWLQGQASVDAAVSLSERDLHTAEQRLIHARRALGKDQQRRRAFELARSVRFTRLIVEAEDAAVRLRDGEAIRILDVHPAVFRLLVRHGYIHDENDAAGYIRPIVDALANIDLDPVRDITALVVGGWPNIRAVLLAWDGKRPDDFHTAYDLVLFGLVDDAWQLTSLAREHVIPALERGV